MSVEQERILSRFLHRDTLVQLPAKHAKRMIVLDWLASKFSPDRKYLEREVNEILLPHHPDVATLRRLLVDHRFMTRSDGVYRRSTRWSK